MLKKGHGNQKNEKKKKKMKKKNQNEEEKEEEEEEQLVKWKVGRPYWKKLVLRQESEQAYLDTC